MTEDTREMLNRIYQPINSISHELVKTLTKLHGGYKITVVNLSASPCTARLMSMGMSNFLSWFQAVFTASNAV